MWWRDLVVLLDDGAAQDRQAADLAENVAMLVDRDDYWLGSEYTSWVTDPDDPQVKAQRAQRRRDRVPSPPRPLLPPVACRTPGEQARRVAAYLEDVTRYTTPAVPEKLTVAEYNRLAGITGGPA